mgnify:CR=1 FL=1
MSMRSWQIAFDELLDEQEYDELVGEDELDQ